MRLRSQANKAGNKRKWIFDSKSKSTQKHIHKQDRIVLCKRKQCLAINFQRQKFNFLQQKTFKYCDSLCLPFTFLQNAHMHTTCIRLHTCSGILCACCYIFSTFFVFTSWLAKFHSFGSVAWRPQLFGLLFLLAQCYCIALTTTTTMMTTTLCWLPLPSPASSYLSSLKQCNEAIKLRPSISRLFTRR